ncbi:MAG: CRTAC1 family protein [Phycisphaeraceae bacterium]|nr:CRTAC1 family protein [Phycisphaeraceae bacterium]
MRRCTTPAGRALVWATLGLAGAASLCVGTAHAQAVRYVDDTDRCNIRFVHGISERPVPPLFPGQNERFGVGAAIGDFNNDGFLDIYIPNSAGHANHLYRNNGDGTFTEVAAQAGVDLVEGMSKQAFWLDLNNDGFDDLIVFNDSSPFDPAFPTTRIFRNNGDGTFTDMTEVSGIHYHEATHGGATAGDIDGDGLLDIFIGGWFERTRRLYRNEGNFRFTDITDRIEGLPADERFHWQPLLIDLDDDGHLDIYAAIDFNEDYALRNNGDGTFTEMSEAWGLTHNANDMGVALGDVNGDGHLDLYTTNMSFSPFNTNDEPGPNALYLGQGGGRFTYEGNAVAAGVDNTFFAWGTVLFDANLNGHLDLLAVNGWVQAEWHTRAQFFLGRGDGTFIDAGLGSGLDHRGDSRGLAPIDIDNNGLLDFVITDVDGPAVLLRNVTDANDNAWLRVKAQGTVSNRNGVGSVVEVTVGDRTWRMPIVVGASFHSGPPLEAHFGLGRAERIDRLRVRFPSGREVVMEGVEPNRVLTVVEPR